MPKPVLRTYAEQLHGSLAYHAVGGLVHLRNVLRLRAVFLVLVRHAITVVRVTGALFISAVSHFIYARYDQCAAANVRKESQKEKSLS